MTTIKLNNTEFIVESYNKSTYFTGDNIMSTANCTVRLTDAAALNALLTQDITSIQIKNDNTVIYTLNEINARIDSLNEYLNGDHISTGINMNFAPDEQEEEEMEE